MRSNWPSRITMYLCILLLILPVLAFGDAECRQPTPQEKAAAEKVAKNLHDKLLAPILSSGWSVASEKSALTALVIASNPAPPRPLMDCAPIFDVQLQPAPQNPRTKKIQDAFAQLQHAKGAADMNKLASIFASGQIEIRVLENSPYLRSQIDHPIKQINVPGAGVAYRPVLQPGDEPTQTTTICFGAWKPAVTFSANNQYIPFPFVHAKGTPYIENMCVNIKTTQDVADEIVKQVDWTSLNQALTR